MMIIKIVVILLLCLMQITSGGAIQGGLIPGGEVDFGPNMKLMCSQNNEYKIRFMDDVYEVQLPEGIEKLKLATGMEWYEFYCPEFIRLRGTYERHKHIEIQIDIASREQDGTPSPFGVVGIGGMSGVVYTRDGRTITLGTFVVTVSMKIGFDKLKDDE